MKNEKESQMEDEIDLTEVESETLIEELTKRGDLPDSDIDDFSDDELREALGYGPDDEDIDWNDLYNKIQCGRQDDVVSYIKEVIQQRTGRIIT